MIHRPVIDLTKDSPRRANNGGASGSNFSGQGSVLGKRHRQDQIPAVVRMKVTGTPSAQKERDVNARPDATTMYIDPSKEAKKFLRLKPKRHYPTADGRSSKLRDQ